MPVLIEAKSVVVRRDAIDRTYPLGWLGFVQDCPNQTLCADLDLARVGFMEPAAVQSFCEHLQDLGFIFLESDKAIDFVVIDQIQGPTTPCDWIEGGDWEQDHFIVKACQLVGSSETELKTPEGWTFEDSLSASHTFANEVEIDRLFTFLREEDGIKVYLDNRTGKEVFTTG